jgi:flagellar biosynthesis protein FlhF
MAYFTEQALTPTECLTKIRSKYGSLAKVLVQRTVRKGGILGIGGHEEIEMTGTYGMGANLSFEEEKLKILANAGKNTVPKPSDLQVVLDEIHKFRDEVGEKLAAPATTAAETNPSIARLEEDLALNDFTPGYIKSIVERVRREFALEDLDDYELLQRTVAQWIGQSISIYRAPSPEN